MALFRHLQERNWTTLFGYLLFVGMMATGYYYNLTFVQLGLFDLGERLVGMNQREIARGMAYLALITCATALAFGWLMLKRGWGQNFVLKLRLAFAVVLVQTLLTAAAPYIRSEQGFLVWIAVASVALGVGVPTTFGMTADLIPVLDRGYVAATITSAAYFFAAVLSLEWRIETFTSQLLIVMPLGVVGLGVLAFVRFAFVERLARQHTLPEFGVGRFVRRGVDGRNHIRRGLPLLIVLMFGIYFVDSLGFLRLIFTPAYMDTSWQAPTLGPHLFIGVTHVVGAFIAGALYTGLSERALFPWVFGIFAMVHLMYLFDTLLPAGDGAPLAMPMLYAVAVSLYTVINFAVWADLSTPRTISLNAALGVALSAWTATFVSTALAIQWRLGGMALDTHFSIVASVSLMLFIIVLLLAFFRTGTTE